MLSLSTPRVVARSDRGVLVNAIYGSAYLGPSVSGVDNSIGEAMSAAARIGGTEGDAIISAARLAFGDAHSLVLMLTCILIALLAAGVFHGLRRQTYSGAAHS